MVKVTLHGDLGDKLGKEWNLEVNSVSEAFKAIDVNTGKLTKYFIDKIQEDAAYEILINQRNVWIPEQENFPDTHTEIEKKHLDNFYKSEVFINFSNGLKTIDVVPVIKGAGGGGGGGGGGKAQGGAGGCFPAGTLISTPNGKINIENIKINDLVYAFDNNSSGIKICKVKSINSHTWEEVGKRSPLLKITHEGGEIILTSNHWVFIGEKGKYGEENKYLEAGELNIEDYIFDIDGVKNKILNIEKIGEYDKVYNFEVEDAHNYIASNIRVHNGGGGGKGKSGGKSGVFKGVFALFAAVAVGIMIPGIGLAIALPAIIGLTALGASMLLSKPPPMVSPQNIANPSADFEASPSAGGGEPSYLFAGPVNTQGEGGPIPVGYGRLIIGSHQIFSSYDQYYRIQSRKNVYSGDSPPVDAGQRNFPGKSYLFNLKGRATQLATLNGNSALSESSLGGK